MLLALVVPYFMFGLWAAERFRETAQGDTSWFMYVVTVLLWPAVIFMNAIAADVPEPKPEEKKDDDDEV